MQLRPDRIGPDREGALDTLVAVIAHSQIVVAQPRKPAPRFPAGFDATDIAILDWIAAHGRRVWRNFQRM